MDNLKLDIISSQVQHCFEATHHTTAGKQIPIAEAKPLLV